MAEAVAAGGCNILEFTNHGDAALPVFMELVKTMAKRNPQMILGIGSVMDAPTTALYIAHGANFVVGPIQPISSCWTKTIFFWPQSVFTPAGCTWS